MATRHDPESAETLSDNRAPDPAVPEPSAVLPPPEPGAGDGRRSTGRAQTTGERRVSSRRRLDQRVMAVIEGMSDAFLAIGPDWRVTYANREAARLNGTTPEALVGRDHWAQWPEARDSEVERQYRAAVEERKAVQFEHYYRTSGVWHEIRAYPADDGGLAIFYRDITAEKARQAELARQAESLSLALEQMRAAETQFRLLVDRVRDYAVLLLDPDGIITQWGEGAVRMYGYDRAEAIGEHLRILYPPDGAEDGSAAEHIRIAGERGEYIGEGMRRRKDGELFPARIVLTALRRAGELVGFSAIAHDLTRERERAAVLARATEVAESASTAKSQFLANTSHEIRTPLNAVMGYAELLELGLAGPLTEQQRQYVSRIQATSQHLLSLINDVLDLSKIEAGEMRAASEPGLVHDAVTAALQLVEPQAHAQRISISNACMPSLGAAFLGDAERVRQIVVNLLSNAVRFTEPGGRVTVSCGRAERTPQGIARDGGWTFIRVQDTGIGIPAEQLPYIWDAFVQADATRTRKVGGSGLGLTISRHLARMMGGDIQAASAPGLGSTFTVWLPAVEPHVVAPPAPLPRRPAATSTAEEQSQALLALRPEGDAHELRDMSEVLLLETERVAAMFVARLRTDPGTPRARELTDIQAEDHVVTFLADVAQGMQAVAEDGPGAAELLRDGSEIQRLIARQHGLQRRGMHWTEEEVCREYGILREEVEAALGRGVPAGSEAQLQRAAAILDQFFAAAMRATLERYREA